MLQFSARLHQDTVLDLSRLHLSVCVQFRGTISIFVSRTHVQSFHIFSIFPSDPCAAECRTGRPSQSIRNQESAVQPNHRGSGRKDPVQGDSSQRGPEQNVRSSVLRHDDVSHLEEYQE